MNDPHQRGAGCGRGATWPVCSKPEGDTEQGLCDMAGNVGQWTQDTYQHSFEGAPSDGSAWIVDAGTATMRVMRGGTWSDQGRHFRAGRRHRNAPTFKGAGFGFRPAL
jgi:formylglycine-generating enzyme required for sulfatase activity